MTSLVALYVQALGEYGASGAGGGSLSLNLRQSLRSLQRWVLQNPVYAAGIALALFVLWKVLFGKRAVG